MSLRGLPDWQQPLEGENCRILYPYEGGANPYLLPNGLELALGRDGKPDFLLGLFRGQNPMLPPQPYGLLDFRLKAAYPLEEGLALLRSRHPGKNLDLASFAAGFLRWAPRDEGGETAEDLRRPVPLAWNSLGGARFIAKLSLAAASRIKGFLKGEILALPAVAELEMAGVSPRLPVRLRFDPAELLEVLLALGNEKGEVEREKVLDFFRRDPGSLPLEISGEIDDLDRNAFAQAVTDRIRSRFGTFVPAPEGEVRPYLALPSRQELERGSFLWDLSEPILAYRPLILEFNPLEGARSLLKEGWSAAVQETVVPALATGVLPVEVSANLPPRRQGIIALGVNLRVPPCPPNRVQAVGAAAELQPPEDRARLMLRLSPGEKPEYLYSTFVVVKGPTGIRRLEGEEKPHAGERLDLRTADFPVDLIEVEAAPSLLARADIYGVCRWPEGDEVSEVSWQLNLDRPSLVFALPKGIEGAKLEMEARGKTGDKTLRLGPWPVQSHYLGLHSFPEYGPQKVEIQCNFAPGVKFLAIDLLPEGCPEEPEEITSLTFTPQQPKREWTYLASSPFQAGYRYRINRGGGEGPDRWSEILSPFQPLNINGEENSGGGEMTGLPQSIRFRDITCYRNQKDPETFFLLPGEPAPERDPLGRPNLILWSSDQGGRLQLATRWEVGGQLLLELQNYLLEEYPQLKQGLLRFSPAPATVKEVALALGDGAGSFKVLQAAGSSGYPPFACVFNVQLNGEEKGAVVAALNGRRDFLRVTYRFSLPVEVSVCSTLKGEMGPELSQLGAEATLEDCRVKIEQALGEGRLVWEREETFGVPALREKADLQAKEQAAALLLEMAGKSGGAESGFIQVSASLQESVSLEEERSTDVAAWFAYGDGLDHVQILPTPPIEDRKVDPPAVSQELSLGFDGTEAPIAFIEVQGGGDHLVLRGPDFAPAVWPAGEVAELTVKTHYTEGGAPYVTTLSPEAESWILTPSQLGLCRVEVDGAGRREAGAKNARIRVRYLPRGEGNSDDRTIYLRHEDWAAGWWVITRSQDLAGELEVEWQETAADGSTVKHPPFTTEETIIKL